MKIEGPNRTGATGKADKAKKTDGGSSVSFTDFLSIGGDVDAPSAAVPVANVGLFVALQAAEHATEQEQRRRAIVRAEDLLEELEDLRIGLLLGSYTKAQLERLSARLQGHKLVVTDPKLLEILNEVEMRAAIEWAKYS